MCAMGTSQQPETTKLRELVLYIALRSDGDAYFGVTKLNKLLFAIDVEALRQRGTTVTGQTYLKYEHGPVPQGISAALEALQDTGALVVRAGNVGGYTQRRPFALKDPDLDVFRPAEVALVDRVLETYRGYTASYLSQLSHQTLGYRSVEMREPIPLGFELIAERPLTARERAYARTLAGDAERARQHAS